MTACCSPNLPIPRASSRRRGARTARAIGLVDAFTPFPGRRLARIPRMARSSHIRLVMFIAGIGMAATRLRPGVLFGGHQLSVQQRRTAARCVARFHAGAIRNRDSGGRDRRLCHLPRGGRLPRLHHSLFAVDGFERASQDRFILALERRSDDGKRRVIDILRDTGASRSVREVEA